MGNILQLLCVVNRVRIFFKKFLDHFENAHVNGLEYMINKIVLPPHT